MTNWAPTEIKVILELADDVGYSHTELLGHLNIDGSHLSKVLKTLRKEGLIFKGNPRPRKDPESDRIDERRTDFPYFLTKNLSSGKLSLLFRPEELEYPYSFASILTDSNCPLASYIKDKFSADMRQILLMFEKTYTFPKSDQIALVAELNRLIQSKDLFDDAIFQGVTFRDKTKKLIKNRSDGIDRILFNRLLMEDAFPCCLRKRAAVHVFSELLDYLVQKEMFAELKKFLSSNYINNIIAEGGFFSLYQIIGGHFVHERFRNVSSELLSLQAVREEFQNIFEIEKSLAIQYFSQFTPTSFPSELQNSLKIKYTDFFPQFRYDLAPNLDRPFSTIIELEQKGIDVEAIAEHIDGWIGFAENLLTSWKNIRCEVLSKFDPLSTVRFHRNNISKSLIKLYNELANRNLITRGTRMFLEYDTHLSPLTSYPFNNYESLLFFQPFQRIYEDVYIIDEKDYDLYIKRARAIYDNFSDLLLDFHRAQMRWMIEKEPSEHHEVSYEDLKAEISALIFYWNITVTKFDLITWFLGNMHKYSSGKYHLRRDGFDFNIIDLESNMSMSVLDQTQSIRASIYPAEQRNPLTRLKPCEIFNIESEESNNTNLEDILSTLKSKLIQEKDRGMPIEIDWQ